MQKGQFKPFSTILTGAMALLVLLLVLAPFSSVHAQSPQLANYFINWAITDADAEALSKWNLVILDMELQQTNLAQIKKIRALNPNITLLVYISAQEVADHVSPGAMRRKLYAGLHNEWYFYDANGKHLSTWPGTYIMNMSDISPRVGGNQFTDYLAKWVNDNLLATGLWDGVFYDNTWDGITWFTGQNIDLDSDGKFDTNLDGHWQAGVKHLYNETRRLSQNKYILVGNGNAGGYRNELNGLMLENFPNYGGWVNTMRLYNIYESGGRAPKYNIINRTTLNTGKNDNYQSVRFGIASALLGNGYFSYDKGDQDHGQTWWYDEYSVKLGDPLGLPLSLASKPPFSEDVWRRDYTNGLALVNATDKPQDIDLGGEYEKIIGTQDRSVNDGSIVTRVRLNPFDGILMLKTYKSLPNLVFKNGAFARFYSIAGARARNGFFMYEDKQPGGSLVYNGDLNNDGRNEKVVVNGNAFTVYDSNGTGINSVFPFGANYKGPLSLAVGRVYGSQNKQIVVATAKGGGQVAIYNFRGDTLKAAWYPLGKKYVGGFSVAAPAPSIDGTNRIVLGTGSGVAGEVIVYDPVHTVLVRRFAPYEVGFKGGISVAAGDFNGDGIEEIATVPGAGRVSMLRVFSDRAKKIAEFRVGGVFGNQVLTLGTSDAGSGGRKDIVVMSAN